jgi:hypothetical protein
MVDAIATKLRLDRVKCFSIGGEKNLFLNLKSLSDKIAEGAVIDCLGLMFDTNASHQDRLTSVTNSLTSTGFEFDSTKLTQSGIYRGSQLPIGLFLSPGNKAPGRIETMIMLGVADSPVKPCLDNFEKCVGEKTERALDDKGRVQIYLGSHNAAHGVAVAFQNGKLDLTHAAYAEVLTMVRELVE